MEFEVASRPPHRCGLRSRSRAGDRGYRARRRQAYRQILRVAAEHGADLLVVGVHGRGVIVGANTARPPFESGGRHQPFTGGAARSPLLTITDRPTAV